uniref:Autoinducer biosynthetic protein/LuxI-type quorum sensing regulator n=1 Tax=Leptospirillum sp. Group II '5-way CG' TaxID=419541 RepID=B6ASI2_9BACT|nr:MAG: autoinducer biosynthetic protein/LuxI-type quorum sensing regulator [Leptospirillum sp. Group II '5-way CG']
MKCEKVCFVEDDLCVREIEEKKDHLKAYHLRHKVYCEILRWVEASPDELEIDRYDFFSTSLGVFEPSGHLLGVIRIIPSDSLFMLEKDFLPLVSPDHRIRKECDTAEITRLTTLVPHHLTGTIQHRISMLLYKGVYHWSLLNGVRYLYFVVEARFLRVLKRGGFPCMPIGPVTTLGEGVQTVAVILDWEVFRLEANLGHPTFFHWIANRPQASPRREPLLQHEHDCVLLASPSR